MMYPRRCWLVVAVTVIICVSCVVADDRSAQLSESSSRLLPSVEEVDSVTTSFPGVVSDWPPYLGSDGGRRFVFSRPGDVGYQGYRIVRPGQWKNGYIFKLLLYVKEDEEAAKRFWVEHPSHEAHSDSTLNLDFAGRDVSEDQLDKWRQESPKSSGLFTWEVMCLASTPITGVPAECIDFFGWVQMCRWVLEIRLTLDGPDREILPSQRVETAMSGIADLVAEGTGCSR